MYTLQVFQRGQTLPRAVEQVARAADVLARIPVLLAAHDDCEKVVVYLDATRLFSVDCHGARLED